MVDHALKELRENLAAAPERFTYERLEKAHRFKYQKAAVDVISMVKRAAEATSPLLTADERVGRAMERITVVRDFTPAQQARLDRVARHLAQNLTLDREDFDDLPEFAHHGG